MKLELLITVVLLSSIFIPLTGAEDTVSEIVVDSDLQVLDVGDVFGGHITWHIRGEIARELRMAIGEKYGVTTIDLGTASRYFKHDLERVIENNLFGCGYLAYIRILRADPLHDDTQGILNDPNDVEGLLGKVNSTDPITIRMLFRGEPMEGRHSVTSENISFAPFYALINNESELSRFHLNSAEVRVSHSETLAGFGSLILPEGTFRLRLIVGMFFTSQGGWVEYRSFDPLESPLILFIIYVVLAFVVGRFVVLLGKEKEGTLMAKRARHASSGMKVGMFLVYLLFPLGGLWTVIVMLALTGVSYILIRKIYGS